MVQALKRIGSKDGEPVIQLKTAFGGGKTHSMLAIYHLLRGRASAAKIPNVKAVLEAAEIDRLPVCRVAVLVGTALARACVRSARRYAVADRLRGERTRAPLRLPAAVRSRIATWWCGSAA